MRSVRIEGGVLRGPARRRGVWRRTRTGWTARAGQLGPPGWATGPDTHPDLFSAGGEELSRDPARPERRLGCGSAEATERRIREPPLLHEGVVAALPDDDVVEDRDPEDETRVGCLPSERHVHR